jgi:glucoamylase
MSSTLAPRTAIQYARAQPAIVNANFSTIAQHMFSLMFRNVASDGYVIGHTYQGENVESFSQLGCIIASPCYPSYPGDEVTNQQLNPSYAENQDYVYNWTRDAAIAVMELVASNMPTRLTGPQATVQPLNDYVTFANTCQNSGAPTIGHACFTIDGRPRSWSEQSDGPALQTIAILQAFPQLDQPTQALAQTVIQKNLNYLLEPEQNPVYQNETTNLWEEESGFSFFARSVQLRCFEAIQANTLGIPVPGGLNDAIQWLQNTGLPSHWNENLGSYVSILNMDPTRAGYDPNIDIVMAAIYGAVPVTDTKLLATAALLRSQWADSTSQSYYPVNGADADQTPPIGPMLGRYPGDIYDGDLLDPVSGGDPWVICTCNFAELYYRLAGEINGGTAIPLDNLSTAFFGQVGVDTSTTPAAAASALQSHADQMLQAVLFHSDWLELSEQFNRSSGYELSVTDLTWSYAAFMSAVRAKIGQHVQG